MKKTIRLTLKSTWFRLIRDGKKLEEYRDIKPYYCARLCKNYQNDEFCANCSKNGCSPVPKKDRVIFSLGYPHKSDHDKFISCKIVGLRKGYGRWLWGAPRSYKVFIIELERDQA